MINTVEKVPKEYYFLCIFVYYTMYINVYDVCAQCSSPTFCIFVIFDQNFFLLNRGIFWISIHLPPLRIHCVSGCCD
jgi:hypothetical protein